MNYKFKSLLLLITTCLTSVAAMAQTTLFTGETEEIPYRIPAIVQTSNEDILVFADKRYGVATLVKMEQVHPVLTLCIVGAVITGQIGQKKAQL